MLLERELAAELARERRGLLLAELEEHHLAREPRAGLEDDGTEMEAVAVTLDGADVVLVDDDAVALEALAVLVRHATLLR